MIEEKTYISQFDIQSDGKILVRKTTDLVKGENVLATTYWRCVLDPWDDKAEEVLNEPFYYNLAEAAWSSIES